MDQVTETDNNMEDIQQLMRFATDLAKESYLLGGIAGLDIAISLIREGVAQLPVRHPDRLFASNDLGCALLLRLVMCMAWPQAKSQAKPSHTGQARPSQKCWPGVGFGLAWTS